MYSQCPECLTRFRVTAAALRAAHGTVRCGQCGSAFDALPHLSDTLAELASASHAADAELTGPSGQTGPTDDGAIVTEFHFSADDIEQVFVDARDWQRRFGEGAPASSTDEELAADLAAVGAVDTPPLAPAGSTAASGAPTAAGDVFVHEPENVEDITLEGERIVIEGHPEDEDEEFAGDDAERLPSPPGVDAEADLDSTDRFEALKIDAAAAAHAALDGSQPVAPSAAPLEPLEPVVPANSSEQVVEYGDLLADDEAEGTGRSRGQELVWGLGALLLALVLAGQLTHHYRQELARDAFFGPPVRAVYARLGIPLASSWNPAAFELRQWGASDAAPTADGRLTLRASLRNRAGFAQPMPLLRLELEDRYGATVARRDFEPREYLKDPAQATRLLAAGAATEAEIAIVDAPADAVGYRLDVCMRDEAASVHCAGQAENSP
jgi:predicted Zn finger-like uncharacterized protein